VTLTCPDPAFQWLGIFWSPCLVCGRLAWAHEQADPLRDIGNYKWGLLNGVTMDRFPPTMLSVTEFHQRKADSTGA